MVVLVAEHVHDVRQALRRGGDDHHACVHEARVPVLHRANVSVALRENSVGALRVEAKDHVRVQQCDLGIIREAPDGELVHHARPPRVDDRVLVHGLRHENRIRVVYLYPVVLEDLQVLGRRNVHHVLRHDGHDILQGTTGAHGADQHARRHQVLRAVAVEQEGEGLRGAVAVRPCDAILARALPGPALAAPAMDRGVVALHVVSARARQRVRAPRAKKSCAAVLVLRAKAVPLPLARALQPPAPHVLLVDILTLLAEHEAH
mmetsp:Transcript_43123/g.130304  ORF Transcript_43123/g.130304 Transcript_43123/m.130304 type:complete len:262 (+) Transcript_43123:2724-3509(+)